MPQGLPRKLRYIFLLQVMLASLFVIVGVAASSVLITDSLTTRVLERESAAFWRDRQRDPAHAPPQTSIMDGYFVPAAGQGPPVPEAPPAEYRRYGSGVFELPGGNRKLKVDARDGGTLYLATRFDMVAGVIRDVGLVSMVLALLAVYVTTWLTYRTSKRLVTPVNWLAQQVSRWDPGEADMPSIAPDRMPGERGSEVLQLSGALRGLARRTQELVRRERDFTRDASHELRTPLTVIRVATDMMLGDPDVPDRAKRSLERMQRAGRDMEAVIDAFLILARENAHAPLTEDFGVAEIVEEEVEKVRPLLAHKPVELEIIADAAPRLHASPRVLAVMLGQLLDNACVFTERGRVEVRICADRLVVTDSGIGMAPEVLRRAWDPFYRANRVDPAGKGMGLSIVRRLGERFRWPVTLRSTPDTGTTATIIFARDVIS